MSKILGDERKVSVITEKALLLGMKCDCCGKVIESGETIKDSPTYYSVEVAEHDFDRNRIGKYKYVDICSDCIDGFVKNALHNEKTETYLEICPEKAVRKFVVVED